MCRFHFDFQGVLLLTDKEWSTFEDYTEQLMYEEHIAGAAVAVSRDGEIVYTGGFGVRDEANQRPVTPQTIFGIASISKSFTALVISQLADEGLLCIDDPVIDHLPEFKLRGVEDMRQVRISHLLSHTTGLPPMKRRQGIEFFEGHIEYLAEAGYRMLGEPGEYFSYCNDAFLLLGAIIERVTEQLYRRAMTERVLNRLGMDRSTYSLEEVRKFTNVSVPYIYNGEEDKWDASPWPDLGTYEVGGGVRSNVADLMKYGQVYVSEGSFEGERIVSAGGVRRMREPIHQVGRGAYYGFALRITPGYGGVTLVEHGGGQPGVSSNFGFVPEKGIAAAVLTNVTGVPAESIWLAAVNTALGLPLDRQRSEEPRYDASQEELERFIGVYRSQEGGSVRIFTEDGCVRAEANGEVFPVRASDERTLVLVGLKRRNVISFFFDDSNRPWAALAGSRMLRKVPQVL